MLGKPIFFGLSAQPKFTTYHEEIQVTLGRTNWVRSRLTDWVTAIIFQIVGNFIFHIVVMILLCFAVCEECIYKKVQEGITSCPECNLDLSDLDPEDYLRWL